MPMPKGRPASEQHATSYIVIGLLQGFALTLTLVLMLMSGL